MRFLYVKLDRPVVLSSGNRSREW